MREQVSYLFKEISFEITHECPLNCIICSSDAGKNPKIKEILEYEDIKKVIEDGINVYKIKTITLSGGEPLIHKNIMKIVHYIGERNLNLILYTSGVVYDNERNMISITRNFAKKLKKKNENLILIFDIQGHNSNLVDLITNTKGSFFLIVDSIKNCLNEGIKCEAHFVPNKINYNYIFETADFLEKLGVTKLHFLRYFPQGRGAENPEIFLTNEEFYLLQFKLKKLKKSKRGKLDIRLGHPINFQFIIDPKVKNLNHHCRGGKDAPLIYPNGELHMCPAWKNFRELSPGNIKENSLKDLWEHNYFREFRYFIEKGYKNIEGLCRTCEYLNICRGKCVAQRILKSKKLFPFPVCMYKYEDPNCPMKIVNRNSNINPIKNKNLSLINYNSNNMCQIIFSTPEIYNKIEKELVELAAEHDISFIQIIDIKNVIIDLRSFYSCKYGCKNFNRKYSCPPFSLSLDNFKKKMNVYSKVLLVTITRNIETFYKFKQNQNINKISYYRRKFYSRLSELEIWRILEKIEALFTKYNLKFKGLAAGSCHKCKECGTNYLIGCKKPNKMRMSMESVSIDVIRTLSYAGYPIDLINTTSITRCIAILIKDSHFPSIHYTFKESPHNFIDVYNEIKNINVDFTKVIVDTKKIEWLRIIDISEIKITSKPICNRNCMNYNKNYSCPPYSTPINLSMWCKAIIWKWKKNPFKKHSYNNTIKYIHKQVFRSGYYFSLSLRHCQCDECIQCSFNKFLKNKKIPEPCQSYLILAPAMESMNIDMSQFGAGLFGIELI